jgi:hypothetical protein
LQENLKPAQILLQLRTSDNETYATNKTISNALQKIRLQDLDGRKPIEALLDLLKQSNWSYDVKVNASGSILNLFFAHPGSIHLARLNHHVALLDSTYKTNRYGLPLLHVIGQTSTNRSFSVAFCFLTYKDEAGYQWAVENGQLKILRSTYGNLSALPLSLLLIVMQLYKKLCTQSSPNHKPTCAHGTSTRT